MPSPTCVEFRFSPIYDLQCHEAWKRLPKPKLAYPNVARILEFLSSVEKEWRKSEVATFKAISNAAGLPWKDKMHVCYVVGHAVPFSDPLTLPVFREDVPPDYAVDVVTHELIHRLLIQPSAASAVNAALRRISRRFPRENENVVIHVLVQAIHAIVYRKVFSEKRIEREKWVMSKLKDYMRAWEIVDRMGAETVVQTFLRKKT